MWYDWFWFAHSKDGLLLCYKVQQCNCSKITTVKVDGDLWIQGRILSTQKRMMCDETLTIIISLKGSKDPKDRSFQSILGQQYHI